MTTATRKAVLLIMALHFLAVFPAVPAFAQAPDAPWKTATTAHFRVHYPAPYEEWALRAASRIESIRDAVVREVGYAPETKTDVLVMNPIAAANGVTLPLLRHPRILLYTEPPDPETSIGEFGDWIDLLTVHETTHLIHLLRPSRNPLQGIVERLLPLNRITLGAPRWVIEGYATVIEGRITGTGRPNSSMRAAVLRKWAASGQLPTYGQLSSDRRFMGMSMAYLAGSAYLEWLEARGGPDSLKHLWARMTARHKRDFNSAFEGVFGDSPQRLYGKFTAELTQRAVTVEKEIAAVEGELWLETKRGSGEPAVSPDGKEIAIVERDENGQSKISIFSTGPNAEEKKLEERIAKNLARDPEDVAPVRTKPVPRKAARTIRPIEGGDVSAPRWLGTSILYTHKQPDADGFLHTDLFVDNREVTHLADVRDADPFPDGRTAIAVRSRFGSTQLVKVDLASGAVTEFTPASVERVVAHPRVGGAGSVAWSEHDATGWHVMVDGKRRGDGFHPEWSGGALYWTVAHNGFIDIVRDGVPVTRTRGVVDQPAPSSDGSLYFMSLEPEGFRVRRCMECGGLPLFREGPALAVRPSKAVPPPPSHAYGIGRQEFAFALGGKWTAYDRSNEIGVRFGDVVGRLDTLLLAATGPDHGQALTTAWRGWPVTVAAHAYRLAGDRGIEVRGEHEYASRFFTTRVIAGASSRAFADGRIMFRQRLLSEGVRVALDSKDHYIAAGRVTARLGDSYLSLQGEAGRRLTLGGFASSVVPQSFRVARVDEPALPHGFATAERYRSGRIAFGSEHATLFWQRYDVGQTIDVRGLEIAISSPPLAIVKTAAFDVTAGAAKVSGLRGVKGWIALRWRP